MLQNCYPFFSFLFFPFLVVTNLLAIGINVLACPLTYAVALSHYKRDKPLSITIMKKQFILVLALCTLTLFACEEEPVLINPKSNATTPAINSFFPESAVCGAEVAISGANFGTSMADNYVTFSGAYAEVTGVGHGKGKSTHEFTARRLLLLSYFCWRDFYHKTCYKAVMLKLTKNCHTENVIPTNAKPLLAVRCYCFVSFSFRTVFLSAVN